MKCSGNLAVLLAENKVAVEKEDLVCTVLLQAAKITSIFAN